MNYKAAFARAHRNDCMRYARRHAVGLEGFFVTLAREWNRTLVRALRAEHSI